MSEQFRTQRPVSPSSPLEQRPQQIDRVMPQDERQERFRRIYHKLRPHLGDQALVNAVTEQGLDGE